MGLFKVKRTNVVGRVPVGLTYGELAVNIADRKLFVGGTAGTGPAIEIVGGGGGDGTGPTWTNSTPTVATNFAGIPAGTTLDAGLNSIQIIERLLYPYQSVSFSGFTLGLAANTFDIGQTSSAGNYNAQWSASSPTGNWITGSVGISRAGTTIASGLNYNSSPTSISHPAYRYTTPTNLSFSLTGQQAQGSNPSASKTYSWLHSIYWGKSASATITALADLTTPSTGSPKYTSSTSSLGGSTYSFLASASAEYCFVVVPTSPGSPGTYTTWKDANNLTFTPTEGTFTETNSHGVSISWKWYRVSNPTFGTFSVVAS
jgi:hypothetical protein